MNMTAISPITTGPMAPIRPFTFAKAAMVALIMANTLWVHAQTYWLDENKKVTTSANYAFRRVVSFKEHMSALRYRVTNSGLGVFDREYLNGYLFNVTDYYRTGEPELVTIAFGVTNVFSPDDYGYNGPAVWYYKSGAIRRKGSYGAYGLDGDLIYYNEDGSEHHREAYRNGKRVDGAGFATNYSNPLVGRWRYNIYQKDLQGNMVRNYGTRGIIAIFGANGVLEYLGSDNTSDKYNWKYIPGTRTWGTLEQYEGNEMVSRSKIVWTNSSRFEEIVTFHPDVNRIGERAMYVRE